MKLSSPEFDYLGMFLEAFLYGIYPTTVISQAAKQSNDPGLYSGIFSMYLQYWYASKKYTGKRNNIVFYALCLLYSLSMVTIGIDLTVFLLRCLDVSKSILSNFHVLMSFSGQYTDSLYQYSRHSICLL